MNNVTFITQISSPPTMQGESAIIRTFAPGRDNPEPISIRVVGKSAIEKLMGAPNGYHIKGSGELRQLGKENDYQFYVDNVRSLTVLNACIETETGPSPVCEYDVAIQGNLGQDPESRYFESGRNKVGGTVALSAGKDKTDWIKYEAWGKTAEFINNWFSKGKAIAITGRLKIDRWKDSPAMIVSAQEVSFVTGQKQGQQQPHPQAVPQATATPAYQQQSMAPQPAYTGYEDF